MRNKTIVTLTGPSCGGKSTLEGLLKAEGFVNIVSTTTRPMREGEVDGKHYHFVDESQFRRMREQGAFIECVEFGGNFYGASVKAVERATADGSPVVLVCEPEGMKQISAYADLHRWQHLAVYVDNPAGVIAERFLKRAGIDIAEKMIAGDPKEAARVTKTYARRLEEMMTTEQTWAKAIFTKDIDLLLPTFDADNQDAAVRTILERLASQLKAAA
ncbi:MAG: guanylate kinase [Pseudomonadota bacterium]|uniref:guanylate kinase n=1 Tax=Ralstonia pickettii TaxID=329 RepID=UPI0027150740|nr:guanylate kinase [Ralstonia pickettii]MEE2976496.1 guanylate kinase [Pseudomonadota bacterium]WKZ86384.1 guanylate kinase [Ralstonia pickettii]